MRDILLQQIYRLLAQITILRRKLIVKKAIQMKGIDFTDDRTVHDSVACVFAVTTLLNNLGLLQDIRISTLRFGRDLLAEKYKNWVPTDKPTPGCIAIAMTGTGIKTDWEKVHGDIKNGHIFIVEDESNWWSNRSDNGLWDNYYSEKTARDRYETKGGMQLFFFEYISFL